LKRHVVWGSLTVNGIGPVLAITLDFCAKTKLRPERESSVDLKLQAQGSVAERKLERRFCS
jgi:hypothetical protein